MRKNETWTEYKRGPKNYPDGTETCKAGHPLAPGNVFKIEAFPSKIYCRDCDRIDTDRREEISNKEIDSLLRDYNSGRIE